MTKSLYPRSDSISAKVIEPSDFESMLSYVRNHIISGLTITASSGLSVTVSSGKATINGLICDNTSLETISGLTDNTVNYIYVKITRDAGSEAESWDFVTNTTGTTPTDATFIGKATTSSGSVISVSYTDVNYNPIHIPGVYFGDASDGDLTISSGTTTITEIKNYDNLTIANGATLTSSSDPLLIFVRNTLTLNGTIHMNGVINNGTGGYSSSAGTGGAATIGAGVGNAGTSAVYVQATVGIQGYNGKTPAKGGISSGSGGGGGDGGASYSYLKPAGGSGISEQSYKQSNVSALDSVFKNAFRFIGATQPLIASGAGGAGGQGAGSGGGGGSGYSQGYLTGAGGNGGHTTATGGNGGAGGGTICIIARNIILNSGSSITSNGTNGTNGTNGVIGDGTNGGNSSLTAAGGGGGGASGSGGGGGAGGGGGLILMIYQSKTDNGATITVTGGTGGTGGTAAARHGNGGAAGTGQGDANNATAGSNGNGTLANGTSGEDGIVGVIVNIAV